MQRYFAFHSATALSCFGLMRPPGQMDQALQANIRHHAKKEAAAAFQHLRGPTMGKTFRN
jgi:hypothetical protein